MVDAGCDSYHTRCMACMMCQRRICPGDEFYKSSDKSILCLQDFKEKAAGGKGHLS